MEELPDQCETLWFLCDRPDVVIDGSGHPTPARS
jgi:hypothetical protein